MQKNSISFWINLWCCGNVNESIEHQTLIWLCHRSKCMSMSFIFINIYVLVCRSITQDVNAVLDERQFWLLDCYGNNCGRFAPRYTRGENLSDFYRKNSNRYAVAMFSWVNQKYGFSSVRLTHIHRTSHRCWKYSESYILFRRRTD